MRNGAIVSQSNAEVASHLDYKNKGAAEGRDSAHAHNDDGDMSAPPRPATQAAAAAEPALWCISTDPLHGDQLCRRLSPQAQIVKKSFTY